MMNQIDIKNILIIFIISIILNFFAKKMAPFLSLVDHPDENLKSHNKPTPSTGGLALAVTIAIGVILNIPSNLITQNIIAIAFLIGIFLLGILDDRFNLRITSRLLVQFSLVIILLFFISPLNISGLSYLDFIISTIFCVACINAVNILDIMDGLAGGIAFFSILNCFIFLDNNFVFYMIVSVCTLIALLGFLIFNFNPAKIFMGNAGSTFLGGLIAVFILIIFQQATTIQEKFSYLFPITVMFFELLFVIVVRIKKGLNPMKGSPDHLALRVRKLGFSVKQTVFIMYFFSAVCVIFSIILRYSEFPLVIISVFCISLLIIGFKMSKITIA